MPKSSEGKGRIASATAGVDDVEVKVTVSEKKEAAAEKAFGLHRKQGEQRHIFFFDTFKLDLFNEGVVLRARKVEGGKDDSTVKIRPVDPDKITKKWRGLDGFKIEADGVGGRLIRSASLTVAQRRHEIEEVHQGKRSIAKLFSSEQEAFLSELSQLAFDFAALAALGPVSAVRWKLRHPGLPYEITAENWALPDKRDLLEVSIKVPGAQAAAATAAFSGFLNELGLKSEGGQQTKTRIVLEFFSKQPNR
jgi:hypothetical protein